MANFPTVNHQGVYNLIRANQLPSSDQSTVFSAEKEDKINTLCRNIFIELGYSIKEINELEKGNIKSKVKVKVPNEPSIPAENSVNLFKTSDLSKNSLRNSNLQGLNKENVKSSMGTAANEQPSNSASSVFSKKLSTSEPQKDMQKEESSNSKKLSASEPIDQKSHQEEPFLGVFDMEL